MPAVIREWLHILFGLTPPHRPSPLPENWDEWSPLSKDLWRAIDAFPFRREAIDEAVARHAPEVVRKATQSLSEQSGAATEADLYLPLGAAT